MGAATVGAAAATAGAGAGAALAATFLGALATGAELLAALAATFLDPFAAAFLDAFVFVELPKTPSKKSILFYTTISARAALSLPAVYAGSSFWLHQSLEKYFPNQLSTLVV